jgi:hypothetical protein
MHLFYLFTIPFPGIIALYFFFSVFLYLSSAVKFYFSFYSYISPDHIAVIPPLTVEVGLLVSMVLAVVSQLPTDPTLPGYSVSLFNFTWLLF